ncbi:hypothetical protein [Rhizobium tubonense]|uniref:hypothetical protein n=1 Tax=Rhizobium tubonense TaxID=484088 RepID=UPI0011B7EC06|nr:hypothetical protein [Rhizobium tubonense]
MSDKVRIIKIRAAALHRFSLIEFIAVPSGLLVESKQVGWLWHNSRKRPCAFGVGSRGDPYRRWVSLHARQPLVSDQIRRLFQVLKNRRGK